MDKELLLKYIAGKASQKEKEDVATWIDADAANLKNSFLFVRVMMHSYGKTQTHSQRRQKRQFHCILLHNESCGLRQYLL
jgi:hypothetical protein